MKFVTRAMTTLMNPAAFLPDWTIDGVSEQFRQEDANPDARPYSQYVYSLPQRLLPDLRRYGGGDRGPLPDPAHRPRGQGRMAVEGRALQFPRADRRDKHRAHSRLHSVRTTATARPDPRRPARRPIASPR